MKGSQALWTAFAAFGILLIAWIPQTERVADVPTFSADIAPILFENCTRCHRPGEMAPFSLRSYKDAKDNAQRIARVTHIRYMPPWLPKPGYGHFANERGLTDRQVETIRRWVEAGSPEGDPDHAPVPPTFAGGWQLGEPDRVVRMPSPYTLPAEGGDVFRNFVIPVPVSTARWVKAVELRPGNSRVVHHSVMQFDWTGGCRVRDEIDAEPGFDGMDMGEAESPQGQILGWTPGKVPLAPSEQLAWRLEPGADLVLQLHMLPTGKPEQIDPIVGFYFTDKAPEVSPFVVVLKNNQIDIPAGSRDYLVKEEFVLPADVEVLSLYPHAHYVCREMKIYAELPDGKRQWLLWIPSWDFHWQDQYRYAEPVLLPADSRIVMEYTYDNSTENPRNPNRPPRRVVHGGRSSDEMATLAVQVVPRRAEELRLLEEAGLSYVAADPTNSRAWLAHNNLGARLASAGDTEGAIGHYRAAVELKPENFTAHNNLGVLLRKQGRLQEAAAEFQKALELRPESAEVLNNLGALLGTQGRQNEAVSYFLRAVRLDPENAELHNNLANALGDQLDEAVHHYREAIRLRPDYAEAFNGLGIALAGQGKLQEAILQFKKALDILPGYEQARQNLAITEKAIRQP